MHSTASLPSLLRKPLDLDKSKDNLCHSSGMEAVSRLLSRLDTVLHTKLLMPVYKQPIEAHRKHHTHSRIEQYPNTLFGFVYHLYLLILGCSLSFSSRLVSLPITLSLVQRHGPCSCLVRSCRVVVVSCSREGMDVGGSIEQDTGQD